MYLDRCVSFKHWVVLPVILLLFSCQPSTSFDDSNPADGVSDSTAVPGAPTNLIGLRDDRTVSLTWQDHASNETAYLIETQLIGGEWEQTDLLASNTETASFTLASDNTYSIRVAAQNDTGLSAYSNIVQLEDQSSEVARMAMQGTVLWQEQCVGCHRSSNVADTPVLNAVNNGSFIQRTDLTMPPGNVEACDNNCATAILAWLEHALSVNSEDEVEEGDNEDVVIPPEAPSTLNGNRQNQVVSLTWQDNSSNEDNFVVQMMPTGGSWADVLNVEANITFAHVTLSSQETVYFRIFAENESGRSTQSNILQLENEDAEDVDQIALGSALWVERECSGCHIGQGDEVADYQVKSALLDDSFVDVTVATMPSSSPQACDESCALAIQAWLQTIYPLTEEQDTIEIDVPSAAPTEAELLKSLHKVSLSLSYQLPTQEWINLVKDEGEAGLETATRQILNSDKFYWRIRDIYSPVLQGVDIPSNDYAGAIGGRAAWYNELVGGEYLHLAGSTRWAIWDAINNEPSRLVEYVIRNDLPFTEILTADYTLVNYFSARAYNVLDQVSFTETTSPTIEIFPYDANEYIKAYLPIPTAGILTSSVFVTLYPTTSGNVNRHRAYNVFKLFLDTDILDIPGSRVEADDITVQNPTLENPTCTGCHNVMDPVASAFRHWQGGEYRQANWAHTGWNQESILPPGFAGIEMPEGHEAPMQWLAQQITQDPRFALSTVKTFFSEITGHPLHPEPVESDSAYTKALYEYQQNQLQILADRFIDSGYLVKDLIVDLVLSDYFKNEQYLGGTSRLINKTQLTRKAQAVFNINGFGTSHGLINGYYSDSQPNGIMALMQRMAGSEIACFAVSPDIGRAEEERILLPYF